MKIPRPMRPTRRKVVEKSEPDHPEAQDDPVPEEENATPQDAAPDAGFVFTTPAGRRFHADVVDELFDAVECANKAETHQHRRFHVRRAAKILAESDREFGR